MVELNTLGSVVKVTYEAEPNTNAYPDGVAEALSFANDRLLVTNVATARALDRTSDVAVETVTCADTTDETTLWTATIEADSLVAGNMLKFHACGVIQNAGSTAADEVTLRVKVGGNTMAMLNPTTKAIPAGSLWSMNSHAVQRTIGVTGSRAGHIERDIAGTVEKINAVGMVNTTVSMDVTLTAQWASADPDNTISLHQAYMEYKN